MVVAYFKGQPSEFVSKVVAGRAVREGMGISFPYLKYKTSIVVVPTSSIDANFVFNEFTNNFQAVAVQGQFTFRIVDPKKASSVMNFSIEPHRRGYLSEDLDRLPQRIANVVQATTREEIHARTLEESLRDSQVVAATVLERIRQAPELTELGVQVISLHFTSTTATPEVARALEADYRESLLRKADQAIYARRAAAVDEERTIKEREMQSDITIATQREELLKIQGDNDLKEAQNRGRALEEEAGFRARALATQLAVYKDMPPDEILALAMKTLGDNASKIGNLTITSEMLAQILNASKSDSGK